jgi:phosphoribosylanthranilate isomerase
MVAGAGVDFLGLNFWSGSKRRVAIEAAPALAAAARAHGGAALIGLFVNAGVDEIAATVRAVGLDLVQVHGDEPPALVAAIAAAAGVPVWKALPVAGDDDLAGLDAWPTSALLLDAPSAGRGGSGQRFDWGLARAAVTRWPALRIVLAGGLSADNVADAIARVGPWAVDVASGVERGPGLKDRDKVYAFVRAARSAALARPREGDARP